MLEERDRKLIRLALDTGAADGEARAAWLRVLELFRSRRVNPNELIDRIDQIVHQAPAEVIVKTVVHNRTVYKNTPPPWETFRLPFGKHRGQTIRWVCDREPQYIRWALKNLTFKTADLENHFIDAVEFMDHGR